MIEHEVFLHFQDDQDIVLVAGKNSVSTKDIRSMIKGCLGTNNKIHQVSVEDFVQWDDPNCNFLITVENPDLRKIAIDHIESKNWRLFSFLSPQALIFPGAIIDAGCVIWPFTMIYSDVRIGKYSTVGPYTGVGHDATIGQNCLVQSNCQISGSAVIEDNCLIGSRSVVSPSIRLAKNSELAAYSALTKSQDQPGKFVGTPARRI